MRTQALPHAIPTTRWTLVERANGALDAEATAALATLCDADWYPIYAYIDDQIKLPPGSVLREGAAFQGQDKELGQGAGSGFWRAQSLCVDSG